MRARGTAGFPRAAALALGCALAAAVAPGLARADDLDDFFVARDDYANGEYQAAVTRFRLLLSQEPPALRTSLVPSARKYFGASLYATGDRAGATAVFERLLRDDPDAQLNPVQFSPAVVQLFFATRERLAPELIRLRVALIDQERAREARRAADQQLLVRLATEERVAIANPRWHVLLPFGLAQSLNGDAGAAPVFFVSEAALLAVGTAGALATAVLYPPAVAFPMMPVLRERDAAPYLALNVGTIAAFALLGAVVAGGVVHAAVTYRPERVELRRRPPPPGFGRLRLAIAPALDASSSGLAVAAAF